MVLGSSVSAWAPPLAFYDLIPPVNTQLSVMFLGGDINFPYWIWNQQNVSPSGGALNPNPYFLGGTTSGWVAEGGGVFNVTNTIPAASPYFWAGFYTGSSHAIQSGSKFAAVAGAQYYVTAFVNATATGSPDANIGFGWWNSSGTRLTDTVTTVTISDGTWQQISAVATAPAGAVAGAPRIGIPNGSVYFQAVIVFSQIPGSLIEAGSVVAGIVDGTTIVGATFEGTNYLENSTGQFIYSGSPALGNLISTIVNLSGTDPSSNLYPAGISSLFPASPGPSATPFLVAQLYQGGVNFGSLDAVNLTGGRTPASVIGFSSDGQLTMDSGTTGVSDNPATMFLSSQSDSGNGQPTLSVQAAISHNTAGVAPTGAGPFFWVSGNGTEQLSTVEGFKGSIPISQADVSLFTNTTTSYNAMSKVWSIPANDADQDTVYRLTVSGDGTQGSTQQAIGHQASVLGATAANRVMNATTIVASDAFSWKYVVEVTILTTGSSGTADVTTEFSWSQGVGGSGFTDTVGATAITRHVATINTTVVGNITAQIAWSSTTGAPTISSYRSLFERLGA
jgi:hypothetical protein